MGKNLTRADLEEPKTYGFDEQYKIELVLDNISQTFPIRRLDIVRVKFSHADAVKSRRSFKKSLQNTTDHWPGWDGQYLPG